MPPTQVPPKLDEVVLETLDKLVNEEGIIELSDEPVTLDPQILNSRTEKGEVNLKGFWTGSYAYNLPEGLENELRKDVEFFMHIIQVKGQKFRGKVEDNTENGGTPGVGSVNGSFTNDTIKFLKKMPVRITTDKDGNQIIDKNKKHFIVVYEGTFSGDKKQITGGWRFKNQLLIWKGIFPKLIELGNGTFIMKKD